MERPIGMMNRGLGLVSVGLAIAGLMPAARAAAPEAPERLVMPHYMLSQGRSVAFSKMEIRLARHHGMEGFAAYFGEWLNQDGSHTRYVQYMDNLFEAARQVDEDFKLVLTPSWSIRNDQIEHVIKRYHDHPNVMRYQGRVVLSPYGRAADRDEAALDALAEEGIDIFYMPFTGLGRHEMSLNVETALRTLERHPRHEGLFRFTIDDSPWGNRVTNANIQRAMQFANRPFMAGVAYHYNSANVRDYQGLHGYGSLWEGLIHDRPLWVQPVTWNDWNEDTNLMPSRWKRDWYKDSFNTDGSFLDATAFWARWYTTGRRPEIRQDKLYFSYRDRRTDQVMGYDPITDEWVDHTMSMVGPFFTQIHDDVRNAIYFSTFLTAPAQLHVTYGGQTHTYEAPAGIWHGELPMQPGVPRFTLERDDRQLLDVLGRRSVIETETKGNSTMPGLHRHGDIRQHHRLWGGAAAAGDGVRLAAAEGELAGDAERREGNGRPAVFIPSREGAAVTLPVQGLADSMYNLRITYSHPGAYDARVTLFANGAFGESGSGVDPDEAGEYYRIPLWLPPTGEGQWATATLFWPLYEQTSFLRIECHRRDSDDIPYPTWNDTADVLIDSVEVVEVLKVEPPPARTDVWPPMVSIPGGTFTMGADEGRRTEQPARQVTISPFAIGKYPVTNEEFERFMPAHAQWRDGYSWRDREPVIYIDWRDAARYCNWLSGEAGLEPAYNESDWSINREADGFRLPTEAEWEYVATGRGEDRIYPWGDDEPIPMVHGNFKGEAALAVPAVLRSQEAMGTTVVGAFPRGASRDGVMDLAGNVMQWCGDWYQYYPSEAQTDPLQTEPGHSRVLRGGSWGYYGYSQRARAREFNSPVYPGYIYIGFRVALPEAGWRKLDEAAP